MDSKLFTRNVWNPDAGEYLIEVEKQERVLVETPQGKRNAVFIKVNGKPYVWFINQYGRIVEKAIETQLGKILSKRKTGKALVKVNVEDVDGRKTYDLDEVKDSSESLVVSIGIYVSDGDGEYHLIHSDNIPIGGEK